MTDSIIFTQKDIKCPSCNSSKHLEIVIPVSGITKYKKIPQGFAVVEHTVRELLGVVNCTKCQIFVCTLEEIK